MCTSVLFFFMHVRLVIQYADLRCHLISTFILIDFSCPRYARLQTFRFLHSRAFRECVCVCFLIVYILSLEYILAAGMENELSVDVFVYICFISPLTFMRLDIPSRGSLSFSSSCNVVLLHAG